jgi:spore germination cell wall hydrolase CwlJ-like protein
MRIPRPVAAGFLIASLAALAAGCGSLRSGKQARECMARAMYFESNRSSDEGMLAVGTVVMNRLESGQFPNTVCGVVGQKRQFAPGVLSKRMSEPKSRERAYRMADKVLGGKRHRGVGRNTMFFHTAGHEFPYKNMNYKLIAGGNAFYEKRTPRPGERFTTQIEVAQRARRARPERDEAEIMIAARSEPREVQVAAAPPPPRRDLTPTSGTPEFGAPEWTPPPVAPSTPAWPSASDPVLVWTPGPPPDPWTPAPGLVWTPEGASDAPLAAAPGSRPASIEDLIALNGG